MTTEANVDFGDLLPHHREQILASGIDPEIARARGYRSVSDPSDLLKLGFAPAQAERVPALLVPIHGVDGSIVLHQLRPDKPRTNKKGKALKYETPKRSRMALDVPPTVRGKLGNPGIPLYITEGSKKADAGVSRGLCVIALLGVWNWRGTNNTGGTTALPDWESVALNERPIYIVFDSDVTSKKAVEKALARLGKFLRSRGAKVTVLQLPHLANGEKQGLDDFLTAGHTVDQLHACATTSRAFDSDPGDERASLAQLAVALIQERYELGIDLDKRPFVIDKLRPGVAILIHGAAKEIRSRLAAEFQKRYRRVLNATALTDALNTVEGMALDCPPRCLNTRVARFENDIYLDLGRSDGQVVRVTSQGWSIVREPRVLFRRSPLTGELPIPELGGDLDRLAELTNFESDVWDLVKAWIVFAFIPDSPHPVLILRGQQGTGKSCAAEILVSLFDPSPAIKRTQPTSPRQWVVAASGSWGTLIDNVSVIPAWWSDALCKAVTGDSWVDRKLFTDDDISVLSFRRVIAITAIDLGSVRGDLADRSLFVELDPIEPTKRRTESELRTAFQSQHPRLLGAALTLLSEILAELPSIETREMPRMADFARFLAAFDRANWTRRTRRTMIFESFLRHLEQSFTMVVETDAVGCALLALFSDRAIWVGTASSLLKELQDQYFGADLPKSPGALSSQLKRLAPSLKASGILVETHRGSDHSRTRLITLRKVEKNVVQSVQVVQSGSDRQTEADYVGRSSDAPSSDPGPPRPTEAQSASWKPDVGRSSGDVGRTSDDPDASVVRDGNQGAPRVGDGPWCSCLQTERWRTRGEELTTCFACHPPPNLDDPDIEFLRDGAVIPKPVAWTQGVTP